MKVLCVAIATGTDAANTEDVQSSPPTQGKSRLSTGMTTGQVVGLVLSVTVMVLVALIVAVAVACKVGISHTTTSCHYVLKFIMI